MNGLALVLRHDTNNDGNGESVRLTDWTNSSGTYSWDVDAGCYLVEFGLLAEQRTISGASKQALCVAPGQRASGRDLVISLPRIDPPSYCEIQIGSGTAAGVEIHDPASRWASSYIFYDANGRFVLSTTSLGPPDDREPAEPSIEWTSSVKGFEESAVYSVAAVHEQGAPSERTTCKRVNV